MVTHRSSQCNTTPRPLPQPTDTIPSHSSSSDASTPTAAAYKDFKLKARKTPRETEANQGSSDDSGSYGPATTINMLPDSVLLEMFDFCRMDHDAHGFPFRPILEWHRLVHVCQRWRHIVFASPLGLNLHLFCTHGTPVRKNLGYWPPLPLIIDYYTYWGADDDKSLTLSDEDDVIAALEHHDRVRYVGISVTGSLLGKMATVMQEPFPMLSHLWLSSKDGNVPVLPEAFLGGPTPRLRVAHLEGIPFPALPTHLSSATDLVDLQLLSIPPTGYVPPDAMVAGLAALTRLETLSIGFQSPTPLPDQRCLRPPPRITFPSLTTFNFRGVSEYLEDLVAQIDAPLLKNVTIMYFNQLIFHIPRLSQFISRTESLNLARFKHARVEFGESHVFVSLFEGQVEPGPLESHFALQISCRGLDWQISHISDALSQSSAILSHVDNLLIDTRDLHLGWRDDTRVEPSEWLELLHPFTAVATLRVSKQLARHVALALEDIAIAGEDVAEMLPALHLLCLEDEPEASVERYIMARRISDRPVNVLNTQG